MVTVNMQTSYKRVVFLYPPDALWGIWDGFAKYASLHNQWLLYTPHSLQFTPDETEILHWLKQFKPDGLIVPNSRKDLDSILELGIPTIVHRNLDKQTPDRPVLLGNSEAIGKMAAEHLLDLGFKYFGYYGFEDAVPLRERSQSFSKRIAEAGFGTSIFLKPRPRNLSFWNKEPELLADWLKSLPKPVGIMAGDDMLSVYLLMGCRIAELLVPEQVAVVGVSNRKAICETQIPKLSSVALNHERAGYEAAELLNKLMENKAQTAEQTVMIEPTHVVKRQSTDFLAIEDHEVAKAVNFIQRDSIKLLQVTDVVELTSVSRNILQKRFKKVLGRSIYHEIRRVRISKIAEMLISTNMSISEIALAMGFSDVDHISRYFRKSKGMTPLAYRKKYGSK